MELNELSFIIADIIEILKIVSQVGLAIIGIYYLIFTNKIAESRKAKADSKNQNMDIEETKKKTRILGIAALGMSLLMFLM